MKICDYAGLTRLQTGVILNTALAAGQEGATEAANAAITTEASIINNDIPFNFLNMAEAVMEKENEMGENMSTSTYQTIQGLQALLKNMIDTYDSNCKCKQ